MKKTLIALALLAASSAGFAAPVTYTIDVSHTIPRFEYSHLGLSKQAHRFDKTSGKIMLDREARKGSVEVEIDATSVNTGFPLFNQHIQGEDFFDTARHPSIQFKSTGVKFDGDKPVAVDGNLTIKGVTRPVTLSITHFVAQAHPMNKKEALGANATTIIKRSEFNMGKFAPNVSDDVTLSIAVEAIAP